MSLADRLDYLAGFLRVRRCHKELVLHQQNLGEHSCGVALLCLMMRPDASANLLAAALTHDYAEYDLGDIPSPTKRWLDSDRLHTAEMEVLYKHRLLDYHSALTDAEERTLSLADLADFMLLCLTERRFGNTHVSDLWRNCSGYANEKLRSDATTDNECELFSTLFNLWGTA